MTEKEMTSEPGSGHQPVPKLIAFYLTQFHPTPENDLWWGKGFTEWTNVTKASPLYENHYQPHLPADFGFYDLRVRATRHDQIRLAKEYGIDGFCYHYYWFSGKRILNLPLDDMLSDPESDMPFCLCWANENWTRRWDAADHEILIAQQYLAEDDINFIQSLMPFFQDARYIKLDSRPFLIVYRPQHLPDVRKTIHIWREYCRTAGIGEIHLCAALTHGNEDYSRFGFDSGIEFPPHNLKTGNINQNISFFHGFQGNVMQYGSLAQSYIDRSYTSTRVFKTVFPSWDNTARTGQRALVVLNGTPENYEFWLSATIDRLKATDHGASAMVFINAWNEWAEGCHLEPDRRFGHAFLQATLNAKNGIRKFAGFSATDLPHPEEFPHKTFWKDIHDVVRYHAMLRSGQLKMTINRRPWLRNLILPLVRLLRKFRA